MRENSLNSYLREKKTLLEILTSVFAYVYTGRYLKCAPCIMRHTWATPWNG